MGLELLFWLVPSFYVSAVAVSFQGFFLGPMFPAIIVVTTKLLPKHLHVPAVGFAAAFGGSGYFPFCHRCIGASERRSGSAADHSFFVRRAAGLVAVSAQNWS